MNKFDNEFKRIMEEVGDTSEVKVRETERDGVIYWTDGRNYVTKDAYDIETATTMLQSLFRCHYCIDCKDCKSCERCVRCKDCFRCDECVDCISLTNSGHCEKCERCDLIHGMVDVQDYLETY